MAEERKYCLRVGRCENDVTPCNPSSFLGKRLCMYRLSLWDGWYFFMKPQLY